MNFGTLRRNIISIDIYINKKLPRPTNIEQFRKKWTIEKHPYGRIKENYHRGILIPRSHSHISVIKKYIDLTTIIVFKLRLNRLLLKSEISLLLKFYFSASDWLLYRLRNSWRYNIKGGFAFF